MRLRSADPRAVTRFVLDSVFCQLGCAEAPAFLGAVADELKPCEETGFGNDFLAVKVSGRVPAQAMDRLPR